MKQFLKNNLILISFYLFLLLLALFFIFSYDKKVIHLYLNQYVGCFYIDNFFSYITWLGDGLIAVIILLAILLYNFRLGLYATSSFLIASLFSIGLKHFFFDDENRPSFIFNYYDNHKLKLVDGVHVYIHNSFPSGHATQAFAILMCLAFVTKKQMYKLLYLALALLTAYSRVHLSQHWLADVTAGSFIGFACSMILYFLFMANSRLNHLNKPGFVFLRFWRLR